jgi:hypothetical protein
MDESSQDGDNHGDNHKLGQLGAGKDGDQTDSGAKPFISVMNWDGASKELLIK